MLTYMVCIYTPNFYHIRDLIATFSICIGENSVQSQMTVKSQKWDDQLKIKTSKKYRKLQDQLIFEVSMTGQTIVSVNDIQMIADPRKGLRLAIK